MTTTAPIQPAMVSFIGIDGIGKSSLAADLRARIEDASGLPCRVVSRRSYLREDTSGFARDSVMAAYDASLRSLYGWARLSDGSVLGEHFPHDSEALLASDFETLLSTSPIVRNDPDALIATAISEVAAHSAFDLLALRPDVREGRAFVLQETHGIKSILKALLLADELLDDADPRSRLVESVLDLAVEVLRPRAGDVSVFVDGDPERALRQRMAQQGSVGGWEHYGVATGDRSPDSYLRLQAACRTRFADIAGAWGSIVADRDADPFTSLQSASDELWRLVRDRLQQPAALTAR